LLEKAERIDGVLMMIPDEAVRATLSERLKVCNAAFLGAVGSRASDSIKVWEAFGAQRRG